MERFGNLVQSECVYEHANASKVEYIDGQPTPCDDRN